jgi:hypothetical protein
LREMGLIEIARSQLRITNPQGLKAAACECYQIVKKAIDLPPIAVSSRLDESRVIFQSEGGGK